MSSAAAHTVYLALGTNLGDRLANLRAARLALAPAVQVEACSPVYMTQPWGFLEQPNFLNQALKGSTLLEPLDLLVFLKQLERDLGRVESARYGPRLIDLDILFYDDLVLQEGSLTVPHPRLHERAFVLVPLNDLDPGLRHPWLHQTVQEMLDQVDRGGIWRYASDECLGGPPGADRSD